MTTVYWALTIPALLFARWMWKAWQAELTTPWNTRLEALRRIERAEVIRRRAALAATER